MGLNHFMAIRELGLCHAFPHIWTRLAGDHTEKWAVLTTL